MRERINSRAALLIKRCVCAALLAAQGLVSVSAWGADQSSHHFQGGYTDRFVGFAAAKSTNNAGAANLRRQAVSSSSSAGEGSAADRHRQALAKRFSEKNGALIRAALAGPMVVSGASCQ